MLETRIKVCHELPLHYMGLSPEINDYEYALVHLFKSRESYLYYNYFKDALENGRKVILDNSAFELGGTSFDIDEYAEWIEKLRPTEYIIPDIRNDGKASLELTNKWIDKYGINYYGCRGIAVVHGKDFRDLKNSYINLCDRVDKLAFSFEDYYFEKAKKNNISLDKIRYREIINLDRTDTLRTDKPHHLLGCILPQEFKLWRDNLYIETIDTSSPVCAALDGVLYQVDGLTTKPKKNINDEFLILFEQEIADKIELNVSQFRKFLI